jgi:hypothetical protein
MKRYFLRFVFIFCVFLAPRLVALRALPARLPLRAVNWLGIRIS